VTAAVGIAVGLERYVLAVGSTIIIRVILQLLTHLSTYAGPQEALPAHADE
jgi:uncharacterized membrane protein YhiD involved in acid resistance